MSKPTFVYVTTIATTLEQLWDALTSDSFTQQYLGEGTLQSDWQVGSAIAKVNSEGESEHKGEVVRSDPLRELAYTFQFFDHTPPARVRFLLEPSGTQIKLTVIHSCLETQSYLSFSPRWTMRLSLLKQLLELQSVLARVA